MHNLPSDLSKLSHHIDAINIRESDASQIQELVEELRQTSNLQFYMKPIELLDQETIESPVREVEGQHEIDQHHSHVFIDLFPLEGGGKGDLEVRFVNDVHNDAIPTDFVAACENAFQKACKVGPLTGAPIVRIGMRLFFAYHHGETMGDSHFFQPIIVRSTLLSQDISSCFWSQSNI